MRRAARAGVAALALGLFLTGCSPLAESSSEQTPSGAGSEAAEVVGVVDGDTLKVATRTGEARVRIIGIDTPEVGRDGEPSECYADEARRFLDQLVYGRTVDLSPDPTQANTDKYGRLLRHVFVDGQNVALAELEAGAGTEYTYDAPYAGQQTYRATEREAREAGRGLWAACTCSC